MAQVACLRIPDLALAAALRSEPELRGRPLAITEVQTARASPQIVAGWMRGLTVSQARAVEPDLLVRSFSAEGVHSAHEALLDVACSAGPRVMDDAPGRVFLDLAGLEALFPTPRGLLTALGARLASVGLESARLGVGPSRTVAELAARHRDGGRVVTADQAGEFLAALPLDLLEPDGELADRLWRWGVRTLGELAQLDRAAVGARLGEVGVHLARRAAGADLTPFRVAPARLRFAESAEPEHPVDNLEPLSFLIRGALDALTRRLRLRGLAARQLRLELTLDSGAEFARDVETAAATLEVPVLTSLLRLALERDPPPEPVSRLRVIATPGSVESAQLDLFLPPLPAPAELAVTVARIESLCGPGQVGAPGVEDTWRPDAARVEAFRFARSGDSPAGSTTSRVADGAGHEPVLAARAGLALRAVRPPRRVRVRVIGGRPCAVDLRDEARSASPADRRRDRAEASRAPTGGDVLQRAGPWRLFGEWWGESRFARDYWDAELDDGGVYRIYHNLADDSWYVDGVYD